MKTSTNSRLSKAAVTILFLILSKSFFAQVNPPYTINNNLSCPVKVMWYINDNSCNPCNNSGGSVGIPAGGMLVINGANFSPCSTPACELKVIVVAISSTPVSVQADSTNTTPALPTVTGCNTSSSQMNWSTTQCDINP